MQCSTFSEHSQVNDCANKTLNVDSPAPLSADQSSDSDSFNGLLLSAKHFGM